jgi:hypothetical protein
VQSLRQYLFSARYHLRASRAIALNLGPNIDVGSTMKKSNMCLTVLPMNYARNFRKVLVVERSVVRSTSFGRGRQKLAPITEQERSIYAA